MAAPFYSRLFSTLSLWAVIAVVIWSGSEIAFAGLVVAFGLATSIEFSLLCKSIVTDPLQRLLGLAVSIGYWVSMFYHAVVLHREPPLWLDLAALMVALQGSFILVFRKGLNGTTTLMQVFSTVFATLYSAVAFGYTLRLMFFGSQEGGAAGLYLMLFVVMVTKFADTGAYAIGSLLGRHKMIPHISPAKSWEGFGGAFVGGAIATGTMLHFFGNQLGILNGTAAWVLFPVLVIAGISGDLAESVLKRCTAIKDSGHSLPGIGGILDLTDSLLFTAPLAYLWLKAMS
ncbi:MAG: phosphatidate cytidylyltransferase [Verrucomicrobiaceae bacterium]|nr:phosphatidate cytidylyltransferase [Verrucomicrobiaceae bacterium]